MGIHFRPFAAESYSGGGSFFNDGLYKVGSPRWVKYDFNGKAPGKDGDGLICLGINLQGVDKEMKPIGDATTQYWSIGTEEAEIHDDGKDLELTGQYPTIWNLSDCGVFMSHLGTAKFDRQAFEDEGIAALDGHVFEFGKVPSPRTQSKAASDDGGTKKQPPQVVVPVRYIGTAGKAAAGSSKAAKGGSKTTAAAPAVDDNEQNMALLEEYLVEKVLVEKNQKGQEKLQARMGLNKYLQQEKKADPDTVKAVSALFNDNSKLGAILNSAGWELVGSTIKPQAD